MERLSLREREVLQFVVEGKSSAEMSRVLGISAKTVDTHRSRLMKKLDIKNLGDLIKFGLRQGLTPPEEPGLPSTNNNA